VTGVLLIDKPTGISSFAVLRELKRRFHQPKMGHLGTLDPLATGLLVVFVGSATKLIPYFAELEKTYEVTLELGKSSDTYDVTGQVAITDPFTLPSPKILHEALPSFLGTHWQVQPPFSALKFQGKRAYEHARAGTTIDLGKRQVTISSLDLLSEELPIVELRVACSSGTYIRSFVHELGQQVGTGAIMTDLRRTQVGPFRLDQAHPLEVVSADHLIEATELIDDYLENAQLPSGEKDYLKRKMGLN